MLGNSYFLWCSTFVVCDSFPDFVHLLNMILLFYFVFMDLVYIVRFIYLDSWMAVEEGTQRWWQDVCFYLLPCHHYRWRSQSIAPRDVSPRLSVDFGGFIVVFMFRVYFHFSSIFLYYFYNTIAIFQFNFYNPIKIKSVQSFRLRYQYEFYLKHSISW